MKRIELQSSEIILLNKIRKTLNANLPISHIQLSQVKDFLNKLIEPREDAGPFLPYVHVYHENMDRLIISSRSEMDKQLEKWIKLFRKFPCWPWYSVASVVDKNNIALFKKNVAIEVNFAPTKCCYEEERIFELHLLYDGTAKFNTPFKQDIKLFPELLSFKGNWKEAYLLSKKAISAGWPEN